MRVKVDLHSANLSRATEDKISEYAQYQFLQKTTPHSPQKKATDYDSRDRKKSSTSLNFFCSRLRMMTSN